MCARVDRVNDGYVMNFACRADHVDAALGDQLTPVRVRIRDFGRVSGCRRFVTKLNACVQAARSVTFVLQTELRHREWFEDWYGPWQRRMKDDVRMRWLVEARNAIEKEGNFDTSSVARVRVALTDDETHVADLEVPPLASPQAVAAAVKLKELDEEPRLTAEDAIKAARQNSCARGVHGDDHEAQAG